MRNSLIFYRTPGGQRRYWSMTSVPMTWIGFVCNLLARKGVEFGDFFFKHGLRIDRHISRNELAAQAYAYKMFQRHLDRMDRYGS